MSRRVSSTLVMLLLLWGGSLGVRPASASPDDPVADEQAIFAGINQERAARGLGVLASAGDLVEIARRQAHRMASENRLHHSVDLAAVVPSWQMMGENVGVGYDVDSLHAAFMGSAGHRQQILQRAFTQVGVGVAWANGRLWVVEVFLQPLPGVVPPPPPVPAPPRPQGVAPSLDASAAASRAIQATTARALFAVSGFELHLLLA